MLTVVEVRGSRKGRWVGGWWEGDFFCWVEGRGNRGATLKADPRGDEGRYREGACRYRWVGAVASRVAFRGIDWLKGRQQRQNAGPPIGRSRRRSERSGQQMGVREIHQRRLGVGGDGLAVDRVRLTGRYFYCVLFPCRDQQPVPCWLRLSSGCGGRPVRHQECRVGACFRRLAAESRTSIRGEGAVDGWLSDGLKRRAG